MRRLLRKAIFGCVFLFFSVVGTFAQHTFSYSDTAFLLDGKPFQMISAEMHYPRIPKEAWRARMKAAKAMGINTIGTYVFWNLHEPEKDKFDFAGNNDIAAFVRIAQEEGLWVVLRPSPYVCAEWEFGGYPYWLQNEKGLVVRSMEKQYLAEYEKYIREVGKRLAPLLVNRGGNILLVQIENEYGSYGSDKVYLEKNRQMFVNAGFDGLLITCDPKDAIANGHLPGLLPAINGVDDPKQVKDLINQNHGGKGPYYIAEWYPAWFDWWGEKHHTVPYEKYVGGLDRVLANGISLNMYMFHGGTTRDFMNGANFNVSNLLTDHPTVHPYEPQVSSYDYDAPLDEAGNPTEKFLQFRKVIEKYLSQGQTLPAIPEKKPAITIPSISWTGEKSVFQLLPKPVKNKTPLTFEALNQAYGFVLYRSTVTGDGKEASLKIKELRDYAMVFVNGKKVAVLDRRILKDSLPVNIVLPKGKVQIDILVENLGRINFGPFLLQNKKGVTESVLLNGKEIYNWEMYRLPFSDISKYSGAVTSVQRTDQPMLKKGYFHLEETGDTYLDMTDWGKGVIWVNGHNLGRYWQVGPQQTVYVPVEWLKKGKNEIEVLELLKPQQEKLEALDHAILDVLQPELK